MRSEDPFSGRPDRSRDCTSPSPGRVSGTESPVEGCQAQSPLAVRVSCPTAPRHTHTLGREAQPLTELRVLKLGSGCWKGLGLSPCSARWGAALARTRDRGWITPGLVCSRGPAQEGRAEERGREKERRERSS